MTLIVPTITAENAHVYREQVERVQEFALRLHIDLMDGEFTENTGVDPRQVWWPDRITADIHLMFQQPLPAIKSFAALKPSLVILQAESEANLVECFQILREAHVQCGISLLAETPVEKIKNIITDVDHLLIFSGNLGHQGGSLADLDLLEKISQAKTLNSKLEIGWDGGVNADNVKAIANAGVDVINVGGFIQSAENAVVAYNDLAELLA